jgi:hypothetical protein
LSIFGVFIASRAGIGSFAEPVVSWRYNRFPAKLNNPKAEMKKKSGAEAPLCSLKNE